ncbi:DNRLRE domain-containing protein [uncultured Clostridium sp.]|uniref:glycoside hydrolase family 78 protein n=1 Tax=uncultured Clostridium sp. TaxID=59620 RepID=UPI0028ED63AE|nr:DNRLRE domain-containing protein [uncultured Clostridium sp.]
MAIHEITLQVKADLFVDRDSPDYNGGSQNTLPTGGYANEPKEGGDDAAFASYFNFDLSVIPYRKKVTYARLYLWNENSTGPEYCQIQAGRFFPTTKPKENQTTYNDVAPDFRLDSRDSMVNMSTATQAWYSFSSTIPVSAGYEAGERSWFWMGLYPYRCGSVAVFHSRENSSGKHPYLVVRYEDVPPNRPDRLYPNGQYVSKDTQVRLSWNFSMNVAGDQKAYKLQYSVNGGATWTTAEKTTNRQYHDIPIGTFPAGTIMWKVQTFNEYDEASPWSDTAVFYTVGLPSTPTSITVTNNPKPLITWSAVGQEIYQVQIVKSDEIIHDSGYVADALNTSYQIPDFLEDGSYVVMVRIGNQYSLFSDWGTTDFVIQTVKPLQPTFHLSTDGYGAILEVEYNADYLLVYRALYNSEDYICIGKTTSNYFKDYTLGNKKAYKYFVRSVKNDNAFNDSKVKTIELNFPGNTLATISNPGDFLNLKYTLDSDPEQPFSFVIRSSEMTFDGREYPTFELSEFKSFSQNISTYLKKIEDVYKLEELISKKDIMAYRANNGMVIYGVVTGYNASFKSFGYVVSFSISKSDYKEGVLY